jgi:ferrochelatase
MTSPAAGAPAGAPTPIGLVVMNLGGPGSLDDVEPFLLRLFGDPDVIQLGWLSFLQPLVARAIVRGHAPKSRANYQLIGGRSPIREETTAQADAVAAELGRRGLAVKPVVAMAAWHPFADEALDALAAQGIDRAVALPLYPQYANATTRSSLLELRRVWPKGMPLAEVCTWHDHGGYLDASAAALRETLAKVPPADRDRVLVVFSAHGLPMSQVRKGDPYPGYIEHSARETARRAGAPATQVTYQSRVGPAKWLGPDTIEFLESNARDRVIVAVPIAFVSEHLETLYDLDILARAAAEKGGARGFLRVPALGTRADFVEALADVVRKGAAAQPAAA